MFRSWNHLGKSNAPPFSDLSRQHPWPTGCFLVGVAFTNTQGLIAMEMGLFDSSIATFFGVHNGLGMGSIYLDGSEEQKQPKASWLAAHSGNISTRRAPERVCPVIRGRC